MTSGEMKRYLTRLGCTFEPGKGGHLIVKLGRRRSILPMPGTGKKLKKGTVAAIEKQLGIT